LTVVRGIGDRFRGLRHRENGKGLLLRTRSVHTLGIGETILVVTIGARGRVQRVVRLSPGRLILDLRARWIAELPVEHDPPLAGWRLRVVPILSGCPEN
jgi:hypothetical protein